MAHTNDTNHVIKPVGFLRESLIDQYGEAEGEARVLRPQSLLGDHQGAQVEGFGLGITALVVV